MEKNEANKDMIREIARFIDDHRDDVRTVTMSDGKKEDVKTLVFVMLGTDDLIYRTIPFKNIVSITYMENGRAKIVQVGGNINWFDLSRAVDIFVDIDEKNAQRVLDERKSHEKATDHTYQ